MQADTTLAPCPFCGGEPSHGKTMDESLWSHETVPWRRVRCRDCEIGTDYVCEGYEPDEIERWNRRAPQAPAASGVPLTDGKLAECEKALDFLACLHTCLTIDGPPMAVAERIFDAVMSERKELLDTIAQQEKNLDWMRSHLKQGASNGLPT